MLPPITKAARLSSIHVEPGIAAGHRRRRHATVRRPRPT
jgi:hypothetical protein